MSTADSTQLRFSLARLLLLMALAGLWLAGLRVLPGVWIIWTFTVLFYACVLITCAQGSPSSPSPPVQRVEEQKH